MAPGVSDKRQEERRGFLHDLNTLEHALKGNSQVAALEQTEKQAYDLLRDAGKLKKLEPKNPSARKESEKRAAPADVRAPQEKPSPSARTADDQLLLAAFQRKVAAFVGGPPVPAIGENVFVQVTIAPDVEPGRRAIRLETSRGLTNPLTFCVGQLPEFFSAVNLSEELLSGKAFSSYRDEPRLKPPEPPTSIPRPAILNGQITPVAVPAEDMTQAFEYRHLVPAQELKVAMVGRFDFRPSVKLLSKTPLKIPAGGTAKIQIGVSPRWMLGKQQAVSLRSAPQGVSRGEVSGTREGMEVVVQTDAAKVKPGQRGNLSLVAAAPKPTEPDKTKTPSGQQQRFSLPSLPSISFEIVKP